MAEMDIQSELGFASYSEEKSAEAMDSTSGDAATNEKGESRVKKQERRSKKPEKKEQFIKRIFTWSTAFTRTVKDKSAKMVNQIKESGTEAVKSGSATRKFVWNRTTGSESNPWAEESFEAPDLVMKEVPRDIFKGVRYDLKAFKELEKIEEQKSEAMKKDSIHLVYSSKFSLKSATPGGKSARMVHHGDKFDKDASFFEVVAAPSTSKSESVPNPWDENGKLSEQFIAKTQCLQLVGDAQDDPNARRSRLALADEDAQRLHHSHVQKGSTLPIGFDAVLARDPNRGKERVICSLACRGILNVNSLCDTAHDISGDCFLVLTETTLGTESYRRIYFYQGGVEAKELVAGELVDSKHTKTEKKEESTSKTTAGTRSEKHEHAADYAQVKKDFNFAAGRCTVSYLDSLTVEDQLVHAFCEQIDGTELFKTVDLDKKDLRVTDSRSADELAAEARRAEPLERYSCIGNVCCFSTDEPATQFECKELCCNFRKAMCDARCCIPGLLCEFCREPQRPREEYCSCLPAPCKMCMKLCYPTPCLLRACWCPGDQETACPSLECPKCCGGASKFTMDRYQYCGVVCCYAAEPTASINFAGALPLRIIDSICFWSKLWWKTDKPHQRFLMRGNGNVGCCCPGLFLECTRKPRRKHSEYCTGWYLEPMAKCVPVDCFCRVCWVPPADEMQALPTALSMDQSKTSKEGKTLFGVKGRTGADPLKNVEEKATKTLGDSHLMTTLKTQGAIEEMPKKEADLQYLPSGEKAALRDAATTRLRTSNYVAVYIRYSVPTSVDLQESVALLSPDQDLSDAFNFVIAVSRPPNQLRAWTAAAPPGTQAAPMRAQLDGDQAQRRAALRRLAVALAQSSAAKAFDVEPPAPPTPLKALPPSLSNTMT